MKKLLLLSVAIFMFNSSTIGASKDTSKKIVILDEMIMPTEIDRSLFPTIEASIDYDMQHIEFIFNKSVGDVNIAIVNDMGQAVGGATCNTSLESIKYISVPIDAGSYTIIISGNDYEGEGHYNIMGDSSEF